MLTKLGVRWNTSAKGWTIASILILGFGLLIPAPFWWFLGEGVVLFFLICLAGTNNS